ncbi:MAG: hypothetical protein JXA57_13785 [Armatimonadetes bacterium]|nr:hypothetical protein [Armatimonadota bacterium]
MDKPVERVTAGIAVMCLVVSLSCAAPKRSVEWQTDAPAPENGAMLGGEAAFEVARAAGMKEGLTPWSAELRDDSRYGIVWDIRNMLHEGPEGRHGQLFIIDARTGTLLDTMGWHFQWFTDHPGPTRITPTESQEPPD